MAGTRATSARGDEADLLRRYLDEIGMHALLSAADEIELARAIVAARVAQEEMDTATERLSVARRRQLRNSGLLPRPRLRLPLRDRPILMRPLGPGSISCWLGLKTLISITTNTPFVRTQ